MADDDNLNPAWRVENLHFTFPDGTEALAGVTLNVPTGTKAALVGPNGAGKSTLFLCSLGIIEGWKGSISFFGTRVCPGTYGVTRRRIGLVFQEPDDMLFMPTVWDDAAFGPLNAGLDEHHLQHRVKDALDAVGMWEKRSKPAHHLSAGEKRRAALACVLSSGAEMLLFDEPTSGLDPRARRGFINTARNLQSGFVIATHDLAMAAEVCSQAFVMDNGAVAASGNAADILGDNGLMESHGLEAVPPSLVRQAPGSSGA